MSLVLFCSVLSSQTAVLAQSSCISDKPSLGRLEDLLRSSDRVHLYDTTYVKGEWKTTYIRNPHTESSGQFGIGASVNLFGFEVGTDILNGGMTYQYTGIEFGFGPLIGKLKPKWTESGTSNNESTIVKERIDQQIISEYEYEKIVVEVDKPVVHTFYSNGLEYHFDVQKPQDISFSISPKQSFPKRNDTIRYVVRPQDDIVVYHKGISYRIPDWSKHPYPEKKIYEHQKSLQTAKQLFTVLGRDEFTKVINKEMLNFMTISETKKDLAGQMNGVEYWYKDGVKFETYENDEAVLTFYFKESTYEFIEAYSSSISPDSEKFTQYYLLNFFNMPIDSVMGYILSMDQSGPTFFYDMFGKKSIDNNSLTYRSVSISNPQFPFKLEFSNYLDREAEIVDKISISYNRSIGNKEKLLESIFTKEGMELIMDEINSLEALYSKSQPKKGQYYKSNSEKKRARRFREEFLSQRELKFPKARAKRGVDMVWESLIHFEEYAVKNGFGTAILKFPYMVYFKDDFRPLFSRAMAHKN